MISKRRADENGQSKDIKDIDVVPEEKNKGIVLNKAFGIMLFGGGATMLIGLLAGKLMVVGIGMGILAASLICLLVKWKVK